MEPEEAIRKAALENAVHFKGKANPKAVLGSAIKAAPDAKKDMGALKAQVEAITEQVNALSPEEQEAALLELEPDYKEQERSKHKARQKARSELPELKDAEQGKVVTRIPPEPSKYPHLGHAISFLINHLYARMYDGKCILRFEDTNPEKAAQEFVDAMESDVIRYLGIDPSEVVFVSDHVPRFHECAADLIKRELAYTCTCPSTDISKLRREMKPCVCRKKDARAISEEWMLMVGGEIDEGAMTLRLKIDMTHKNAVMRDPVIMRVCKTSHYRQGEGYKVWPMYDFENALEDSWLGVTHVFRTEEFATRIELQEHIKSLFELPLQHVRQYGRITVAGMSAKGREIREAIESGGMIGWDDPRLLTLRALHRRGIQAEAIHELAKQVGMSKATTNLDFGVIAAINRRILDDEASRYFFIEEPVAITVEDWPEDLDTVELKLHPHKERGGRPLKLDGKFYLAKKDYDAVLQGKVFRLIDTINLQYNTDAKAFKVHSRSIDEFRGLPEAEKHGLIHFLPQDEMIKARVFTPEAEYVEGFCEPGVAQLREGAIIQFERFGFCRLDAIDEKKGEKTFTFWFGHE